MIKIRKSGLKFDGKKLRKEMPYPIQWGKISTENDFDEGEQYLDIYIFDDNLREVINIEVDRDGNELEVVTYQKRTVQIETVMVDGVEETKEVEVWNDYTAEFEDILADIDTVISNHDPTPLPAPPTTDEYLIDLDYRLTMQELGL